MIEMRRIFDTCIHNLIEAFATTKAKVIVGMAVLVHDACSMPERSSPSAPVFVSSVGIEDKPAAFHFGVAQVETPATRHLAFVERQIHVFRRVTIQVVDLQRAVTSRKVSRGKSIGSTSSPASSIASGRLLA
jgi:hypothetical protein